MVGGAADTGYQIEQSLRFRANMKLARTPSTSGNRRVWTVSVWAKHGGDNSAQSSGYILFTGTSSTNTNQVGISIRDFDNDNGRVSFYMKPGGSNQYRYSTGYLRDNSAWYHHIISYNYGTFKYFLNGEEHPTTGSTFSNFDTGVNSGLQHRIGYGANSSAQEWNFYNGLFAEYHLLDGTAVTDPYDFGEFDDNGCWRPIEVSGVTYGTNGFYLKFDPTASNSVGHDHSGNGNHFTYTNFALSSSSQDYDVLTDTPTNNHAVFNVNVPQNGRNFYNGALLAGNVTNAQGQSTIVVSEGKWYAEFQWGTIGSQVVMAGVSNKVTKDAFEGATQSWQIHYSNSGKIETAGSQVTGLATWVAGDVIGVAFDCSNGNAKFYKNGTYIGQGTNSNFANVPVVIGGGYGGGSGTNRFDINTGQRGSGTAWNNPPSGYEWLMTSKMPDVDVPNPETHFNVAYWSGNSASRTIDIGMQPDMVWIKSVTNGADHVIVDSVRGATKVIRPNLVNVEYTQSDSLTGFVSNGFTLGADTSGGPSGNFNLSGRTYMGWAWKKASGVFDIVTYTGNGTSQTISHNLGATPAFAIVKQRNATNGSWVWHQKLGNNVGSNNGMLDLTSGGSGLYTDDVFKGFTSTNFQIGADHGSNESGKTYVMYLWAEVPGFSNFQEYRGNQSSDGIFHYTGFRPAWLMVRARNGTSNWTIWDRLGTGSNLYNPASKNIAVNGSASWQADMQIDFLANGFKLRTGDTQPNYSGYDYIVAAFAEHPFGGGNVSPGPAR